MSPHPLSMLQQRFACARSNAQPSSDLSRSRTLVLSSDAAAELGPTKTSNTPGSTLGARSASKNSKASGGTVKVTVAVSDPYLARLGLYRSSGGSTPQRFEMTRVKEGFFRFTLPNLGRDLTYHVAEGNHRSRHFHIRVRRRPRTSAG